MKIPQGKEKITKEEKRIFHYVGYNVARPLSSLWLQMIQAQVLVTISFLVFFFVSVIHGVNIGAES